MLVESSDLINLFEAAITACCSKREPKTMCFDCQGLRAAVKLIKQYVADPRTA